MSERTYYFVIYEGELQFVSEIDEEAYSFAEDKNDSLIGEALTKMDCDDPDIKDYEDAAIIAGQDGGIYEVYEIDMSKYSKDDYEIDVGGTDFEYEELMDFINEFKSNID